MAELTVTIPNALQASIDAEVKRTGSAASSVVVEALAQHFGLDLHTLFQVSTSGALVAGVYAGVVSAEVILQHGDFGMGTFANLDGEMVILDGHIYRIRGNGSVSEVPNDALAPFAVVTRFNPQRDVEIKPSPSLDALTTQCDVQRMSSNIFYAIRLDGLFQHLKTRAVNPAQPNARLVDAAKAQTEFEFNNIRGTLVGIWSPGFSSAFSVAGYHFHFLSDDRQHGGHLLEVTARELRLRVEALTDFHLALPENESFLKADLSKNSADELAYAEQSH